MFRNHDSTLDQGIKLKDAGLIAATAVTQVDGSDKTHDVGAATYQKGRIFVDISACEVATGDELYVVQLQGSETSNFSTAYQLATLRLGDSSVTGDAIDSAPVGRRVLEFDNVANTSATLASPKPMRYLRLRTVVSGNVATGINYAAWMVTDN